ncbi:hypothetical protein DEJ50_33605 [Streptomyces venezuelae]|uniref:Uncharacterized protein n=1 Tax=Streptomyces venezuelae TaxID=54571 RepID=A0A5P2DBW9_STRVZ|nr:hypothetical protein [Streptomyces venezuelae]QES52020.1 hypothetical protein DEJ50_33605 [Streptomyces venezuelae]
MTWNEAHGTVSRAFSDWHKNDEENRAFLKLTAQWSEEGYERQWKQTEESFSRVFDPEIHYGDEHVDMFDDAVGGLWPYSHQWMVESSALKNAVTAFEVYLEKGLQEVVEVWRVEIDGKGSHRLRLRTPKGFTSPGWKTLVTAHGVLGSTVTTPDVEWARDLRHLLTHQNGELRDQEALDKFRDAEAEANADLHQQAYVGGRVHLGVKRVVGVLDALAAVVRHADVQIHNYGPWGEGPKRTILGSLEAAKCLDFIPE